MNLYETVYILELLQFFITT